MGSTVGEPPKLTVSFNEERMRLKSSVKVSGQATLYKDRRGRISISAHDATKRKEERV